MSKSRETPPGSNYNPSAWSHRLRLIFVALTGFVIAAYLSLYQFKIIHDVLEPFFGNGSKEVLHSFISKMLPVPDALIGVFSYFIDIIACLIGDETRWKTKPWITIALGLAAIMFALVSITLIAIQAAVIHAYCTLCICSALISLIFVWPATAEFRATIKFLKSAGKSGNSFWKAFWGNKVIVNKAYE